jgi:hypothetical protein
VTHGAPLPQPRSVVKRSNKRAYLSERQVAPAPAVLARLAPSYPRELLDRVDHVLPPAEPVFENGDQVSVFRFLAALRLCFFVPLAFGLALDATDD